MSIDEAIATIREMLESHPDFGPHDPINGTITYQGLKSSMREALAFLETYSNVLPEQTYISVAKTIYFAIQQAPKYIDGNASWEEAWKAGAAALKGFHGAIAKIQGKDGGG